jgi:hypothetical protein
MEAYHSSHSTLQKVQVRERRSFDPIKALTVGWLVYVPMEKEGPYSFCMCSYDSGRLRAFLGGFSALRVYSKGEKASCADYNMYTLCTRLIKTVTDYLQLVLKNAENRTEIMKERYKLLLSRWSPEPLNEPGAIHFML